MSSPLNTRLTSIILVIFQDVSGISLEIPMPDHPVPEQLVAKCAETVAVLERLIDAHDVVFLLTDSRESRWLPTVICAAKSKVS